MQDNILFATNSMRTSVSSLKKKVSNLKINLEVFDAELEKIETKFDKLLVEAEIYKSKLERELSREVRRLERELDKAKQTAPLEAKAPKLTTEESKIATTVGIFEAILRHMCQGADDFRLMSEAFIFPAVIERVVRHTEDAYFLDEVPQTAYLVMQRGRTYLQWIRSECETHLTDPQAWENYVETVTEWWRNDALPLIYGARDEQWDIDVPLTLTEMITWRDNPGDRPLNFSAVFDAYEIFRKNKDAIYEPSGLREFDLKAFSYDTPPA